MEEKLTEREKCRVTLKPGREKLMLLHHPWGFSGAIARVEGSPEAGDLVCVETADGRFVAWAFFNPASKTSLRLVEWDEKKRVDDRWWREKIGLSIAGRRTLLARRQFDGVRLVHGESDGLPGLVCDLYRSTAVIQITTAAADRRRELIVQELLDAGRNAGIDITAVYERSDPETRALEGLKPSDGPLRGRTSEGLVELQDGAVRLLCSITGGQKGGLYFDQRENRRIVARYSAGLRVLDCFAYTGGFSVHALFEKAAHVTLIDSSKSALDTAAKTMEANGFGPELWTLEAADVFRKLRDYRKAGKSFDLVILDPPKLARSRSGVEAALRAYKDLNLTAISLLPRDGLLGTFSCSGRVSREQFRTAVAWAAKDAGRQVQILETLSQAADHPVRLSFPESEYLKGYLLRMVS